MPTNKLIKPNNIVSISGVQYVVIGISHKAKTALLMNHKNKDLYISMYPCVETGMIIGLPDGLAKKIANWCFSVREDENYLPPQPADDWPLACFYYYEAVCRYINDNYDENV